MPEIPWNAYLGARLRIGIGEGRWADVSRSIAERDVCGEIAEVIVITAWNPGGDLLSHQTNAGANDRLIARCSELGLTVERAVGMSASAEAWWAEPSVAVAGMTTEGAIALGVEFGQLAIYRWRPATRMLSVIECGGTRRTASTPVGQRIFSRRPCPLLPAARGFERCVVPESEPLRSIVADRRAVLLDAVGCDSCGPGRGDLDPGDVCTR